MFRNRCRKFGVLVGTINNVENVNSLVETDPCDMYFGTILTFTRNQGHESQMI